MFAQHKPSNAAFQMFRFLLIYGLYKILFTKNLFDAGFRQLWLVPQC